ncbi:MAG: hypothetical protein AAGL89_17780 [Pseudomonadota bacterium]
MPQADLKYSSDLSFDAKALLGRIEALILRHDAGSGACKGRADPADVFHQSHVLLRVALLRKPHRDAAFRADLVAALVALLDEHIPDGTERAVEFVFSSDDYATGRSGA